MKCMKNSKIKFVAGFVVAALFMAIAMSYTLFAAGGADNEITSVTIGKNQSEVILEVSLTKEYVKEHKSDTLYIFEFLPYESTADIDSMKPVKEFNAAQSVTVKVPFYNGSVTRLYSKFVVAERSGDGTYDIITKARYVDNIADTAKNTEAYPEKPSKKGLQIQMFADAQQLGVAHTVLNVAVNEYLHGETSDAAQSFIYNGDAYYIDRAKLALLDHKVKTYTDAGINVYFNIILTAPDANAHPSISGLYFEGASPDATLYALNTKNEAAMKSFQALMDYLAARYTRADRAYGFVPAFIVGFEVNSNRVWNNAGDADLTNYIYSYCTAFRVAYTAMASHYENGRVYISLGNNFTAAASDLNTTANARLDYPSKDFLDSFAAIIKSSGDIPWGLSVNPYASSPALAEFWNDEYATDDFETRFITMKNIGTLTEYMHRDELLYGSEVRSVIIGEFGISGDPASDDAMKTQAAAYALAYYRAEQNEDIDAFIYHRHVDHVDETQYYGIWMNTPGSTVEPLSKKPLYNVFSLIDTQRGEEVIAFIKDTVKADVFSMFMAENVKYKQFIKRTVFEGQAAALEDYGRGYKEKMLFDLTKGKLCDFYPTDGAQYVEVRSLADASQTVLYAKLPDTANGYVGIGNSVFDSSALDKAHCITFRIMVMTPVEIDSAYFTLRLQDNGDKESDSVAYEGQASVNTNEWCDVSFDIKDFTLQTDGEIDLMKLWLNISQGETVSDEYGIALEGVTIHVKKGMGVFAWILIVILILIFLVVAAYGALVLRARYIKKKRREAAMRRRMMQTQQMNRGGMYPPTNGSQR